MLDIERSMHDWDRANFLPSSIYWRRAHASRRKLVYNFANAYDHVWARALRDVKRRTTLSLDHIRDITRKFRTADDPPGPNFPYCRCEDVLDGVVCPGYSYTTSCNRFHLFIPFESDTAVIITLSHYKGSRIQSYFDEKGNMIASFIKGKDQWNEEYKIAWNYSCKAIWPDNKVIPEFPA